MNNENELTFDDRINIMAAAENLLASMLNYLGDDELSINSSQPCGDYILVFKRNNINE